VILIFEIYSCEMKFVIPDFITLNDLIELNVFLINKILRGNCTHLPLRFIKMTLTSLLVLK